MICTLLYVIAQMICFPLEDPVVLPVYFPRIRHEGVGFFQIILQIQSYSTKTKLSLDVRRQYLSDLKYTHYVRNYISATYYASITLIFKIT
jgi:hypothetical protein